MKSLTYNRPYQYVEDLRLFACYRSKDHAVFVGQGFADNAVAFIETGPMLTKLEQQGKVVHGDFDQLITQSFDVNMPFRIYVVNPDDENGKASNAIEYTSSPDIPIIDVKVDGKSVVKDQIAYIDLTGKLDVIMKPNKIYGTDSDGKETQFDRSQIEGIQHFFINGEELPVDMGNVRAIDIAKESKTVQRVDTPLQLYGTNQNGVDATYPKDFFATSESVVNATKDIADLQTGKQDKDRSAKDGYIAIMKNGQSVGSDNSLKDTLDKLNKASSDLTSLTDKVTKGLEKDWKATAVEKRIINHPVSQSSIIITDLSLEQENKFRNVTNGVVYGRQPESLLQNGVAVGSGNSAFENASAFGNQAKAKGKNSISLGAMSESDGENSVALGAFSNAKSAKGVAIGPTSSVTGSNSVAIGADSVADADNTVSVGFDTKDPNLKSAYRRITAVDTPVNDHDAVNKTYVDSHVTAVEKQTEIVFIGESNFNGEGVTGGYQNGMAKTAAKRLNLNDHNYSVNNTGYLDGIDSSFDRQIQKAANDTSLDKNKVKYVVIGGGVRADSDTDTDDYTALAKGTILKAATLFPYSKIVVIPGLFDNSMPDKLTATRLGSFYRMGKLANNIAIVDGAYTWGFGENSDDFSGVHPTNRLSDIYGGYIADCCEHMHHEYFVDKQWHQEGINIGSDFNNASATVTLSHGLVNVIVRGIEQKDASGNPGTIVTVPNLPKIPVWKAIIGYDDGKNSAPIIFWYGNQASCGVNVYGPSYAGRTVNGVFTYNILCGI